MSQSLAPPQAISSDDDLSRFDCGRDVLSDWLCQQALRSEGASARTYVVKDHRHVVGYYCLATGGVARGSVPRKIRHGLPDPVPVMILGRLAVDKDHQRVGIGGGLLKDALRRTLQVSTQVGVRAVLVHAIDEEAATFYAAFGFIEFPSGTGRFFLPVESIAAAL